MGKAALDLPDPLQAPPQEAKASTDDLLAQLAGDEIDRLLAEADAGQPAMSRAPFHVGPPTGPDKLAEPIVDPQAPAAPAGLAEISRPSPTEMEVAAEMDALFSAAVAKDEADAQKAAVAEAEAETSAAERDGLKAPATIASAAHPKPAADEDAPVPFYLYPLVWLNAPLMILPESVRDIVGKVAIVTLINAAAILAYVLVVRRGQ